MNDWGLWQTHGNVMERCQDWYGQYPAQPVTEPIRLGRNQATTVCCAAARGSLTAGTAGLRIVTTGRG
jgi:formylglycine-generating enzyme required for sulfatase activity